MANLMTIRGVGVSCAALLGKAAALAERLCVPLLGEEGLAEKEVFIGEGAPFLLLREDGLSLVRDGMEIHGDFSRLLPRLKPNNLGGELPVRAAKVKKSDGIPLLIDATAGMGEDSLLLAAAGFRVILFERDPVIAALLRDTMERAALLPELSGIIARMTLREEDSIAALPRFQPSPDVVFLDPMFPQRRKSGLVKKKFQLIHLLEQPCSDEEDLLRAALAAHPAKIIVKRPAKGPFLAGVKPSHSVAGKSVRYDVIVR